MLNVIFLQLFLVYTLVTAKHEVANGIFYNILYEKSQYGMQIPQHEIKSVVNNKLQTVCIVYIIKSDKKQG